MKQYCYIINSWIPVKPGKNEINCEKCKYTPTPCKWYKKTIPNLGISGSNKKYYKTHNFANKILCLGSIGSWAEQNDIYR